MNHFQQRIIDLQIERTELKSKLEKYEELEKELSDLLDEWGEEEGDLMTVGEIALLRLGLM